MRYRCRLIFLAWGGGVPMHSKSLIAAASDAGIDSLVVVCWPSDSWNTTATALPGNLPFFRLVTLLDVGEIMRIVQFCLRADPRTPEQEEVLDWFCEEYQPLVKREVMALCPHHAEFGAEPDDLCQEVWLKIGRGVARVEVRSCPGQLPWLGVCGNAANGLPLAVVGGALALARLIPSRVSRTPSPLPT